MAGSAEGVSFVITPAGEIFGSDSGPNRELVRRIKACVNACEGLSTEQLEDGIVEQMRAVIGRVAPLLEKAAGGEEAA
ncbi:MAG: hypothetical protein AAF532_01425 [Planctomycetota bacterium]